jgi:hypoxanthine phosphoribosyltransferase
VDTGLTVKQIEHMLRRQGPRSLRIAALLDKPGRRIEPVKLNYVGFEAPDEFLVGYGLDFDERYRNLPDVHVLESGSRETASLGQ